MSRVILIALDSVGIDPLGHDRDESVYSQSRFLFPRSRGVDPQSLPDAPIPGVLVETSVTDDEHRGAIECAITYTSIFSGQSALERHGLMRGLGMNERTLQKMVAGDNLFRRFESPCLANAIFPAHLTFLGTSYIQNELPSFDRRAVEAALRFDGRPVCLKGAEKHGFAELFTMAEINQNIFVYAALEAGMPLKTWADVRQGEALTSTMTHELESRFNWDALGEVPLPRRTPRDAADVLASLSARHDFTFYKYQMPDLISHTGQVELAREVFETIESFVEAVLEAINPNETIVIVTSDHGHLEQVAFTQGHPKSKVPTWYFGQDAETQAARLQRPEGIFHVIANFGKEVATA